MNDKNKFMYLVEIQLMAKQIQMVIQNHCSIPQSLIKTMVDERIEKYINESFSKQKQYNEIHLYKSKMLNKSSYTITDLTNAETYNLELKFDKHNEIKN